MGISVDVETQTFLVSGKRVDLYAARSKEDGSHGRMYHFAMLGEGDFFKEIKPVELHGSKWVCIAKLSRDTKLIPSNTDITSDLQSRFELFVSKRKNNPSYENVAINIKKLGAKEMTDDAVHNLLKVNEKITNLAYDNETYNSDVIEMCAVLCKYLNVEVKIPTDNALRSNNKLIDEILFLSGVRCRNSVLRDKWWKNESGILIATLDDSTPIILIPHIISGYIMYNSKNKKRTRVTAEIAARINTSVKSVFRTFPSKKLGIKNILSFMLGERIYKDLLIVFIFSAFASLVQILPPILSAQIFDTVIPNAMYNLLLQLILILLSFELANIGFSVIINLGLSRINTKLDVSLQAAVWDRLLNLKVSFFHGFSTSELLNRINGFNLIRRTFSPDFIKGIITALFSFINIYVLFRYNSEIAPYALLLFFSVFIISIFIWRYKFKLSKQYTELSEISEGLNNQILSGIERVKISAAEERAFYTWSKYETDLRYLQGRIKLADNFLNSFYIFYEFASTAFIYLLIFLQGTTGMGSFIAFLSSFMIMQHAILSLLKLLTVFPEIIPLFNNITPIFKNLPEYYERKIIPSDIDGSLEFNNVSFRYAKYSNIALQDVSFKLMPGQCLGVVGMSGSGKSTILRLLLGFYELTEGKIYVSGYDLETIDLRYLRQKTSVVLQDSRILTGTLYENITDGDLNITEDEVLRAIKTSQFQDDIKNLPDGLQTYLSPKENILSKAQKQKLLIARAVVKKSNYMLFDEATSALDSVTQEKIIRNLKEFDATKIIIAQRLSTVCYCDKIIVINEGKITNEGTYDDIIRKLNSK